MPPRKKRVPFSWLPFRTFWEREKKGKPNFTDLWAIFCGRHRNDIMYLSLYLFFFFFFMFTVIKQFTYEITLGRVFCPNNLPFSLPLFILVSFLRRLLFVVVAPTGKKLDNCRRYKKKFKSTSRKKPAKFQTEKETIYTLQVLKMSTFSRLS